MAKATLWSYNMKPTDKAYVASLARSSMSHARARAAFATSVWNLGPNESALLERLVLGDSNQAIAAFMGCDESLIELQVAMLLDRADVDSRAALMAAVWRL